MRMFFLNPYSGRISLTHPPILLIQTPKNMFCMANGKSTFNVHWPNSLGLIEGFSTVCEQPWVDFNPQFKVAFAVKATTLTTAPRRPYTAVVRIWMYYIYMYRHVNRHKYAMFTYNHFLQKSSIIPERALLNILATKAGNVSSRFGGAAS